MELGIRLDKDGVMVYCFDEPCSPGRPDRVLGTDRGPADIVPKVLVELLQEAIETERLPMRCIGCGERIAATPEQARKHGYEVWPGGCRCPTCQQPDVVPVDAIGARVKELEVI
jgi:hypothetical protein